MIAHLASELRQLFGGGSSKGSSAATATTAGSGGSFFFDAFFAKLGIFRGDLGDFALAAGLGGSGSPWELTKSANVGGGAAGLSLIHI